MAKSLKMDQVWMNRITELLDDMEFGSLHIVVHEGQIVQMERTERKRFGNTSLETSKQMPERSSPRSFRKSETK